MDLEKRLAIHVFEVAAIAHTFALSELFSVLLKYLGTHKL